MRHHCLYDETELHSIEMVKAHVQCVLVNIKESFNRGLKLSWVK